MVEIGAYLNLICSLRKTAPASHRALNEKSVFHGDVGESLEQSSDEPRKRYPCEAVSNHRNKPHGKNAMCLREHFPLAITVKLQSREEPGGTKMWPHMQLGLTQRSRAPRGTSEQPELQALSYPGVSPRSFRPIRTKHFSPFPSSAYWTRTWTLSGRGLSLYKQSLAFAQGGQPNCFLSAVSPLGSSCSPSTA